MEGCFMAVDEPCAVAVSSRHPSMTDDDMQNSGSDRPAKHAISRESFVALTVRYERRVRVFVSSLHPRPSDVDEILQEAWLVAWKKLDSFRFTDEQPDEEFVRWLCTIARYQVCTYRRKNAIRLLLNDELIEKLTVMQFEKADYFEARHEALLQCIESLRARDKELIRRRYQEGVSAKDLACGLGRSIDTVYKSLHRIRASLSTCIERTLKQEGLTDG
jgi:RNA polymerase sigma-70 factor (ECF subfamily)